MLLSAELSRILKTGLAGLLSMLPCCLAQASETASALPKVAQASEAATPPKPSADYSVRGKTLPAGGDLHLSYSGGRMRLEVSVPAVGSVLTGITDFTKRRAIILSDLPGVDVVGFEIDMPAEYGFANMPADAIKGGHSSVGSEPCEIWTSPPSSEVPIEVCLTLDGIPLKAKAVTMRGKSVSFEATELERMPQDPALFEVPKGVKVRRVPRGMEGMIPGLNPY